MLNIGNAVESIQKKSLKVKDIFTATKESLLKINEEAELEVQKRKTQIDNLIEENYALEVEINSNNKTVKSIDNFINS